MKSENGVNTGYMQPAVDVDLHIHTTASDGTLTPAQVVRLAKESGFKTIAITDHDTLFGVGPAVEEGRRLGIEVLPGVEISCEDGEEYHILCYGVAQATGELKEILDMMHRSRMLRVENIINSLTAQGVDITTGEVLCEAQESQSVGRPHIARVLVKKGYARNNKDAFNKYLIKGAQGFCGREKISPDEALGAITDAGGISVLAHPALIADGDESAMAAIRQLSRLGLRGLECYHPSSVSGDNTSDKYVQIAKELGLIITGGSDFHGTTKCNRPPALGEGLEGFCSRHEWLKKLKDAIGVKV